MTEEIDEYAVWKLAVALQDSPRATADMRARLNREVKRAELSVSMVAAAIGIIIDMPGPVKNGPDPDEWLRDRILEEACLPIERFYQLFAEDISQHMKTLEHLIDGGTGRKSFYECLQDVFRIHLNQTLACVQVTLDEWHEDGDDYYDDDGEDDDPNG